MSRDANIRVRLDLSGARADLAGLYNEMGRAPGISPAGVPGVGTATAAGGAMGIGRLGGMGLGVAGILGMIPFLGPSMRDAYNIAGAGAIDPAANFLTKSLFGDVPAQVKGDRNALAEVKEMLGLSIGLSSMDPDERRANAAKFTGLVETMQHIHRAKAYGDSAFDDEFLPKIAGNTWDGMFNRMIEVLDRVGRVLERLNIGG